MRSRYTAYALGLVRYIVETTAPGSPHARPAVDPWLADLKRYCSQVHFDRLDVHATSAHGDVGTVRFTAHLRQGDHPQTQHEHSRFTRVQGRWLYWGALPK